jgi:hypothetical protein
MQQDSIDWLIDKINGKSYNSVTIDIPKDIIEAAKNIYRQELINACTLGYLAESSIEYQNLIKLLKK